ncbi:MAG: helix-turn-helix domain-containing protein [Nitrospirota bacterium]
MIKKIENLNFYELLEITPSATMQDIHKAYERIRRIYDPNSIALYSLFSPEETAEINKRIEEAYRTLIYEENRKKYDAMLRMNNIIPEEPPVPQKSRYQPKPFLAVPSASRFSAPAAQVQPTVPAPPEPPVIPLVEEPVAEYTGPVIKNMREQRRLTIRNIADTTKISSRFLDYIEAESFTKLPARPYLRGFLILYAQALGCDPERMTGDYLKRYDAGLPKKQ